MRSIPGSRMILLDQVSGVGSDVNTLCKFWLSIFIVFCGVVRLMLLSFCDTCCYLFSSCCVGVVAVYLFFVYICSLLVMVYLCSVYLVLC